MKQLLVNSLMSLVTGFCFAAGIFGALSLFEETNQNLNRTYVDMPSGFEFQNHKILEGEPKFTIEGELINTQDIEWANVQLEARIYAGSAYMTYCRNSFDYVGKKSSRNFRLGCRETSGINLPENISYKLSVIRATRE